MAVAPSFEPRLHGHTSILADLRGTSSTVAASEPWPWGQTELYGDLFSWEATRISLVACRFLSAHQGRIWEGGFDPMVPMGVDRSATVPTGWPFGDPRLSRLI